MRRSTPLQIVSVLNVFQLQSTLRKAKQISSPNHDLLVHKKGINNILLFKFNFYEGNFHDQMNMTEIW